MSMTQFGTEAQARRKRVYFEGSTTIYEGMPVAYNYDTDDNILGWDKENDQAGSTTADGYQNEGRFLRVELLSAANAFAFAGVVAGGSYAGLTGPRWIEIYIPNGAIVPVRTDKSITIKDKLYLEAGQPTFVNDAYTLPYAAVAMETVDRSSTAGLVLAKLEGVRAENVIPTDDTAAKGFGATLWADCPVEEIKNNPGLGVYYFNDFLDEIDITDDDGWAITTTTSGAIVPSATDDGGAIVFDSAGHASADDGIEAQLTNCLFKSASGRKIWFEARVKMNDATDQYFVGLAGIDTTLMASGVLDDVVDKCGFYHEAASTDDKISTVTARADADDKTTDVADNADDTYVTLGFVIDGLTSVKFYVNDTLVETGTTAANIPNDVMALSFVSKTEETDADSELTVDWVRVVQLGRS
ncbi:MAG: hypothetical protein JRI56_00260 [Deltaproteobacteria bacterium]|nr:hypothetical protein [Deltaproteobacteria bacterium]